MNSYNKESWPRIHNHAPFPTRLYNTRRLTQAPCIKRARPHLLCPHLPSHLTTYVPRTRAHYTRSTGFRVRVCPPALPGAVTCRREEGASRKNSPETKQLVRERRGSVASGMLCTRSPAQLTSRTAASTIPIFEGPKATWRPKSTASSRPM